MADAVPFGSPKRKREVADLPGREASPLRLRTDVQHWTVPPHAADDHRRASHSTSPQSHMSDDFRHLHIHHGPSQLQHRLSFRGKVDGAAMRAEAEAMEQLPPASNANAGESSEVHVPAEIGMLPAWHAPTSTPARDRLAPPSTPPLHPISPNDTPRAISPLQPLASSPAFPPGASTLTLSSPTSPSTQRPRSPPPSATALSDLVWSAGEITGHLADDPADDGTGINGVGFRPTPALAAQRAMRRRQQVEAWRSREAREARSRRAERRRGVGNMTAGTGAEGVGAGLGPEQGQRRVRFVEG